MEPFGLFNLLKSAVFPDSKTEDPAPSPDPPSATDSEQNTTNAVPTKEPNAFLDFMTAHDERAKRVKKRP